MKTKLISLLVLAFPLINATAQQYTIGDVVEDYTFTDYRSGGEVSLYELGADGGVLVLEWFAWWCPFCANAAANVETGIVEYYADGGNPHGVPVKHISLNVQGGARAQSDSFISKYNLGTVLEDYDRSFFNRFNPSGGQPLFVVLNAEPGSPSAERWEILYTRLNYAGNAAPDISALMRPVIDSVMPGSPANPLEAHFSELEGPNMGWYESPWFGWINGEDYPLVHHLEHGYGYLVPGTGPDSLFLYDLDLGWLFTGPGFYPFLYSYQSANWLFYQQGSEGNWFFDYSVNDWRNKEQLRASN